LADIFLSYAREDLAKAKLLAAALEKQGWSVFWDRTSLLAGQDFDQVIEQAIEQAGCMIVAWSTASKRSDWVRGEANIGRERKILVPVLFEAIEPPIAFRALHTENFAAWKGETDSSVYLALCNALTKRIGPGKAFASDKDLATHQPSNKPKKPEIRWSKQLAVKIGKISFITATLTILLWFVVPVFFSQKDESIPSKGTSADLKMSVPLIGGTQTQAPSAELNSTDQPLIKEPEMVKIPAGSFQMGSNDGSDDEKPLHSVTLKSFAIGRYEVTFDEYDQFAKATGKPKPDDNGWGRGERPVINVSWENAVAYVQWLSNITGKHFRLPTEAEWEYAARAKTTSDYYWDGQADDFAWFIGNSAGKTHQVGQKNPNTFGVYDTAGNVWEWVQDCYEVNYNQAPKDGTASEQQD
jgi:formylglycine-generating enzyme required for sulfatase activity